MNALTAKVKAAIAAAAMLVAIAISVGLTWWVMSTSHAREVAELKQQRSDDKAQFEADRNAITTKAQQDTAAALSRMKAAQEALALLDAQKSKELADAQAENDALKRDVADGTRRVRILSANLATAQLTARQRATGGNRSTSSVGDDQGAELSSEAGLTVFDLRAGIIRKEAQLDYLQNYVLDVVKQCKR